MRDRVMLDLLKSRRAMAAGAAVLAAAIIAFFLSRAETPLTTSGLLQPFGAGSVSSTNGGGTAPAVPAQSTARIDPGSNPSKPQASSVPPASGADAPHPHSAA